MSTSAQNFNARIIDEFRRNGGKVSGMFEGTPLLLLHHTGARSGKTRVNPLAYQADGDRYIVFASKAGAPSHPGWYHNLIAHPRTTIELGTDTIDVIASELTGEDRDRIFRAQVERAPTFGDYEKKAGGRVIPVIALTPARQ